MYSNKAIAAEKLQLSSGHIGIGYLINQTGHNWTGVLSYTPYYGFNAFRIGASATAMPIADLYNTLTFELQYGLTLDFRLSKSIWFHVISGLQYDSEQPSAYPFYGGGFSTEFESKFFRFFDGFFINSSDVFIAAGVNTVQFTSGLLIRL